MNTMLDLQKELGTGGDPQMSEYEINIVHLYPDLLNLYGDKGNIACLEKRLSWRGIRANVRQCTNQDHSMDLSGADIIFVGGGSDREQEIVCSLLLKKKDELIRYVESDGVLVAVCGGYQLLGKYYQTASAKIEGLGILDICTDAGADRLIGNVVLESDLFSQPITGFENHAGRTLIGNHTPLGRVVFGHGNTGDSGCEGVSTKCGRDLPSRPPASQEPASVRLYPDLCPEAKIP